MESSNILAYNYREGALMFKDFRILYSIFYFVTFNWEYFHVDGENKIIFSFGDMAK
jgi:hypothetical protein